MSDDAAAPNASGSTEIIMAKSGLSMISSLCGPFIFGCHEPDHPMTHYDVFNGDADGITALHQLRLAWPLESVLVTGVKRDVALLNRVDARGGDTVTVLDVSLDANRTPLLGLLERGVRVDWFDHHYAGSIPEDANLHAQIDDSPDVCASMLVDRHLSGRFRLWAVVGAFGDNLGAAARRLAASMEQRAERVAALQMLGESLNYNAYGDSEADLLVAPAELYAILHRYQDPFDFIESEPLVRILAEGQRQDMQRALSTEPEHALAGGRVFVLPDTAWSRRVRGVFANRLAVNSPKMAFAVLTPDDCRGYAVSVRAPLRARHGAQELCRLFPSGGGRVGAAGINHLPRERVPDFLREFERAFAPGARSGA